METTKATSIQEVNDALMVEIFSRAFPSLKLASRYKLVSKSWNSLLSSPGFAARWNELHPFALLLNVRLTAEEGEEEDDRHLVPYVSSAHPLFRSAAADSTTLDLGFLPCAAPGRPDSVRVAASCNDLLLCHSVGERKDLDERVYYICNPLTQDWVAVPAAPETHPFTGYAGVGLVCDEGGKRFAVVRIHMGTMPSVGRVVGASESFTAEVFSSETNKWVEVQVVHPENEDFRFDFGGGKDLNQNLFSWNGCLFLENKEDHTIVVYDPMELEKCRIFNIPVDPALLKRRTYRQKRQFLIFAVSQGSFRVVQHIDTIGGGRGYLNFYELKDFEKEEWVVKGKIYFDEFDTDDDTLLRHCEVSTDDSDDDEYISQLCFFFFSPWLMVLAVDPFDDKVFYFYLKAKVHKKRRIFSCNLKTKEVKVFDDEFHKTSVDGYIRNVFGFAVPLVPTPVPNVLPLNA